ncbi:MAG: family 43 glycosylhydrolase [Limisphaerales bacterium]
MQIAPWLEGAWMTKRAGIYYLQYAAPGTQFKTYADGVYTATNPTGPFAYASSSPFSHKPTGFITGAGTQQHDGWRRGKLLACRDDDHFRAAHV